MNWQQLKGLARQKWALLRSKRARAVAQQASEKQLAEWRADDGSTEAFIARRADASARGHVRR